MKFIAAIVTLFVVGFCGLISYFIVLVLLNGFSDSDGGVALSVYGWFAFVVSFTVTIAAVVISDRRTKQLKPSPVVLAGVYSIAGGCAGLAAGAVGALVLASVLHSR